MYGKYNNKINNYQDRNIEKENIKNKYYLKMDLADNLHYIMDGRFSEIDAEVKQMSALKLVEDNNLMPELHKDALKINQYK